MLVIETLLVPPSTTTTCAAGVGVGSLDHLAPADLATTGMNIVVFNRVAGSRVPLPEFGFMPNAVTTNALALHGGVRRSVRFTDGKKYLAKGAGPAACPPDAAAGFAP